jgi:hypothetical protein
VTALSLLEISKQCDVLFLGHRWTQELIQLRVHSQALKAAKEANLAAAKAQATFFCADFQDKSPLGHVAVIGKFMAQIKAVLASPGL